MGLSFSFISRTAFAGTPITTELSGISFVTPDPAEITELLPIVTPGITETLAPNQQLSPTVIGRACSNPSLRASCATGLAAV